MAKLSAYGQREIGRVVKERTIEGDEMISWERIERAVMHNGRILERRVIRFHVDAADAAHGFEPNGRRHDYGWKLYAHLKSGVTPEAYIALCLAPRKDGSASPWSRKVKP